MSELSSRLQAAKGDRSIDDIARQAEREGHHIHRSVVARFLKGEHGPRPQDKSLAALAAGFGLDVRELRMLAGLPAGELGTWEPTSEASRLNREQRDALDQLIRTIVRGETDARNAEARKKSPDGGPVVIAERPFTRLVVSPPEPRPQSDTEQRPHPAGEGSAPHR